MPLSEADKAPQKCDELSDAKKGLLDIKVGVNREGMLLIMDTGFW